MKLWNWIYPGLYGLLNYAIVRLITDSASGYNVLWERDWRINAIEIVTILAVGYTSFRMIDWYERKHKGDEFKGWREVFKEFAGLAFWNMLLVNSTVGVVTATTDNGMDFHDFVIINTIPQTFVMIVYAIRRGNYFLQSFIASKLQLERIEKDKVATELALLKSQYHPHFLFNSLNTVYFQMDESVEDAKNTIERLSDLLRYQLYEENEQKVSLSKELAHVGSYIDLQKVRHASMLEVDLNLDVSAAGRRICPLLFIPLVENAFKYVGGEKRIGIKITDLPDFETPGTIEFCVHNTVAPLSADMGTRLQNGGLGLTNLRRRLELLYPGRFSLEICRNSQTYEVKLTLKLDED